MAVPMIVTTTGGGSVTRPATDARHARRLSTVRPPFQNRGTVYER
jgi:hypothetical protein